MKPLLDRHAGALALVLAASAIAVRLTPSDGLPPFFAPWLLLVGFFTVAALLLAGLVRGAADGLAGERSPRSLPSPADLRVALPSHLVLCLVPFVPGELGVAGVAGLALYLLVSRSRVDVMAARLDGRGHGTLDLYASGLFLLAGLFLVVYLGVALDMVGGRENDASYYFGVARWMAAHRTLEEPIVWHFLAPPRAIVHPAFDYWQGLTSVLLAIPMAVFGRTHLVASVTMAVLSAATVFAFTYLVAVARPFASRATQLAAVIAFALSPAMQAFRFDTETLVVFHLGLLSALIAIAHGRLALGAGLAFLVFLTRADGLVTCGLVWLFVLWRALGDVRTREGRRALGVVVGMMGGVLALYLASNLARFGVLTPPGARQGPFLTEYLQLYEWSPSRHPGSVVELLTSRATLRDLREAFERVDGAYSLIDYVLSHELLRAVIPIGLLVFVRPRSDETGFHRLALLLVVLGSLTISWLGPVVFSEGRTLHPLVPAMALATFATLEWPARSLARRFRARPERARTVFALLSALTLLPALALARPYRPLAILRTDFEAELAELDPVLDGANVATTSPWWVIANTESPAVLLPAQGESAMAAVLLRYDVEYVLFTRDDAEGWGPASWQAWTPYRDGARTRIGPFRLERARETPHVILYRVIRVR